MSSATLEEVDSIEIQVIITDELDVLSKCPHPDVKAVGPMSGAALSRFPDLNTRNGAVAEIQLEEICCGAFGLSLMITATKGDKKHTLLFDTGPEEEAWKRNATRSKADIGKIEHIHLSHWHRDHSGGMLEAIRMINSAKQSGDKVTVDLHPNRPDYRGVMVFGKPMSLQADPTFDEIEQAGGIISKNTQVHSVLDDMFLISGEIPRITTYEGGIMNGARLDLAKGEWEEDTLIQEERFVMCNLKGKGLVVFTGCSHAGVINVSQHALELVNSTIPLYCVVGGYHLADATPEKLQSTIDSFKTIKPNVLLAGHCTGWRFKVQIEQQMPGVLVPCFAGTKYTM